MTRIIFFFFQAEDGIRDLYVTGVQTCALPIYAPATTSRPFQSFGKRRRNRAWPSGSEAMRAFSCTPGTALTIGVRLPALGAITVRSVVGVKAPIARPIELSGGVVCVFVVVRSALAKQLTSARLAPNALIRSAQLGAATPESGARAAKKRALRSVESTATSFFLTQIFGQREVRVAFLELGDLRAGFLGFSFPHQLADVLDPRLRRALGRLCRLGPDRRQRLRGLRRLRLSRLATRRHRFLGRLQRRHRLR